MPLGADNMKTAQAHDLVVFGVGQALEVLIDPFVVALCHGRAKLAQLLGGFVVRPDRLRRLGEKRAIDFRDKRGN